MADSPSRPAPSTAIVVKFETARVITEREGELAREAALTAWGLRRYDQLRAGVELPPVSDPGYAQAVTDIDGILRGKVMHIDKFLSSAESGFGFCDGKGNRGRKFLT